MNHYIMSAMDEQELMVTKLTLAAANTGWIVEKRDFDPALFHLVMRTIPKVLLYAHVDNERAEEYQHFLDEANKMAGYGPLRSFDPQSLHDHTLVVGSEVLLMVKGMNVSVDFLQSVLQPDKRAKQACFSCGAPGRYIDEMATTQCMQCSVRICRGCVEDDINRLVAHFSATRDLIRPDDTSCPNCLSKRLCDRPKLLDRYVKAMEQHRCDGH